MFLGFQMKRSWCKRIQRDEFRKYCKTSIINNQEEIIPEPIEQDNAEYELEEFNQEELIENILDEDEIIQNAFHQKNIEEFDSQELDDDNQNYFYPGAKHTKDQALIMLNTVFT